MAFRSSKLMQSVFVAGMVMAVMPASVEAQRGRGGGRGGPEVPAPIAYRQSMMQGINAHRGALGTLIGAEVEHQGHILGHARALNGLAMMSSDIFAEGTGGELTRARDEIWQDADGFAAALTAFQEATGALVEAAEAGDGVGEAFQAVGRTCAGCHRPFRKPANQ